MGSDIIVSSLFVQSTIPKLLIVLSPLNTSTLKAGVGTTEILFHENERVGCFVDQLKALEILL
jgi:hypothetical protein